MSVHVDVNWMDTITALVQILNQTVNVRFCHEGYQESRESVMSVY